MILGSGAALPFELAEQAFGVATIFVTPIAGMLRLSQREGFLRASSFGSTAHSYIEVSRGGMGSIRAKRSCPTSSMRAQASVLL